MAIDIQVNLGLALLIIGMLAAAVAVYFISYLERKDHPDKQPSLVTRTIIISLVIISIMLVIIYVSGEKPNQWHYIGMFVIVMVVFASQYYEAEKTKIKRPGEIFHDQLEHISEAFSAKIDYKTYGHTWPKYKVTEIPGGKVFDIIANSLVRTNLGFVLIQSNPYDKSILSHEFDPDPHVIEDIFGRAIARKYDEERLELLYRLQEAKNEISKEGKV